jgi:hypothetical protein
MLLRATETADHTGEVVSRWDKRKMGGRGMLWTGQASVDERMKAPTRCRRERLDMTYPEEQDGQPVVETYRQN